jgi:hypothetical protein
MPPNPSTAAIKAMIKSVTTRLSMVVTSQTEQVRAVKLASARLSLRDKNAEPSKSSTAVSLQRGMRRQRDHQK